MAVPAPAVLAVPAPAVLASAVLASAVLASAVLIGSNITYLKTCTGFFWPIRQQRAMA